MSKGPGCVRYEIQRVEPAQLAEEVQEAMNIQSAGANAPATFPQAVAGRVNFIRSTLESALGELQALANRNHGHPPENSMGSQAGSDMVKPSGAHAVAFDELEYLELVANRIISIAQSLNATH